MCGANPCTHGATAYIDEVDLTVDETSGPTLSAGGVWDHAGWIRGSWPLTVTGDSPSGVCSLSEGVQGDSPVAQAAFPQDVSAWHQCSAGDGISGTLNTTNYADGAESLYVAGADAAGATPSAADTVYLDNTTPSVTLSTPNDPDLNNWVNHAVTVDAAVGSGPSGIAATDCTVDSGTSRAYPTGGVTVDEDGTHTVSCSATGNAVDPNGGHATGSSSTQIKIDEAPPSLAFEPTDPADPTALSVRDSDGESGVASGSITMQGPHATAPVALPTSFDGAHLSARFNDATRHGAYTFVATSCDVVGNCASTSEALHFPIRLGSSSLVSFAKIQTPARTVDRRVRVGYHIRTVRRRVRVGYHYRTVIRRRHGRRVARRVKVGGHFRRVTERVRIGGHLKRVKVAIHVNRRCGHHRVKVRAHRWREITVCRRLTPRIVAARRVGFGRGTTLHGLLTTRQGAPIADAPVRILTRPQDRGGIYRFATETMTDSRGAWTARLRGGPSRAIRVYYPGSDAVEPATTHATLTVPAMIRLHISPHILPWSHRIAITGHLVGRYVPHDGVALRLLVRYPHSGQRTPLQALRTTRHGGFDFTWSYHAGRGVATYPFSIATTATETDYPYAASSSPPVRITFGRRTPHLHRRTHRHRHRHRRGHRHRHRHPTRRRHHTRAAIAPTSAAQRPGSSRTP